MVNLLVFFPVEERVCCTKLLRDFMYYSSSLYFVYTKIYSGSPFSGVCELCA